jgi:phenylalanyl-tRNA synthetase beta chain
MKLSLNWIKDFVKLPDDMDLTKLAYDLTMSTVEVEGAENLGDSFKNIIVGKIKEVNPHPNADKLRVCSVDIGGEVKNIVCGGSNLAPEMKVAVAKPGATVRWHGEGEPVEIKNAKLRGVESYGMICAANEIGLSDLFPANDDHEIVDLSSFEALPGENLAVALGLDDIILEIDNKSMTNRPDLWGHYGIAREIAALYDLPLKDITPYVPVAKEPFDVRIKDTDRCSRYIGAKISGLSVKPSPFEMQSRIFRVGMRPINALVDISNYVMLALGQPTHLFDSDMIKDYIEVRRAKDGEELTLLNDKKLSLSDDDLVIADGEGAVALAGVMGGAKDSVLPTTKSVILEIGSFDSRSVRRTALRYDNRTEASSRYEKAIDTDRCDSALSLTMQLLSELYPEMKEEAFTDNYPKHTERATITLDFEWLRRRLGKDIPKEVISRKLGTMGFDVSYDGDSMTVVAPTWRSTGDVSIKADVMEEVARMYGYENFEATTITASFSAAVNQLDYDLIRKVKEYLAFRANMQEIFTYPWMSDECVKAIMPSEEGILALATPPSPTERLIKCSLLPNICRAIVKNEHSFEEFDIFEEGLVFKNENYTANYKNESLPSQRRHLGLAFVSSPDKISDLYRRAKGVIEAMPSYTHMEGFTFTREEKPYWADDVVWQNISLNGKIIGSIGLLSKKSAIAAGIKVAYAVLAEIDMDEFIPFKSRTNTFRHLPEFPINDYDISFLVDSMVKWEDIRAAAMEKTRGGLLRGVDFVDEYKGKQVPDGKKSITLRLYVASDEKTLTSGEVEEVASGVMKKLEKTFGAERR